MFFYQLYLGEYLNPVRDFEIEHLRHSCDVYVDR